LTLKAPESAQPLKYKAKEVHFNGPAEHKLNGHRFDMEMQIMHKLEEEGHAHEEHSAVLAVLFKRVDDFQQGHPLIDKLIHHKEKVDFTKELGLDKSPKLYWYRGTHTAPPSVDLVSWLLLAHVLPVTGRQIAFLHDHWHDCHGFTNFRIAQPLYGRKVHKNF
jgi:carbonic anhydrase